MSSRKLVIGLAVIIAAPLALAQVLSLRTHGALGDGQHDDTKAVQAAIDAAPAGAVLEGEGARYSVRGSIRIERDLGLRDATFVQADGADDDPELDSVRTLFVRGTPVRPVRISLSDVTVDRGRNPRGGSPAKAAGIWIANAKDSLLERVRITGNGRGTGLLLAEVRNVTVRDLQVYEMTWAPCTRQAEGLPWSEVRRAWNEYRVVPMANCAREDTQRVRIEEPLAGVVVVRSQSVRLLAPHIDGLYALFSDGRRVPWQTDGITIGSDALDADGQPIASDIVIDSPRVSRVWEGVDMSGQPLTRVQVRGARVQDVHAIGIKVANGGRDIDVVGARVERSGLAGIVISGSNLVSRAWPAPHAIRIADSVVLDTGASGLWTGQAGVAGIRIMNGSVEDPTGIDIDGTRVEQRGSAAGMAHGLHAECRGAVHSLDLRSDGQEREAVQIAAQPCR